MGTFDNLKLGERLGAGAWAEVYALGDDRCLKVARAEPLIQKDSDAQGIAAGTGSLGTSLMQPHEVLVEQGKTLQALTAAGWIRCHDIGSYKDKHGDVAAALILDRAKGRPLQKGDAPLVLLSVCDALAAARKDGLVAHLDLKPSNVFVADRAVTLLDPGYYDGAPDWRNIVTTVAYNPYIEVSDVSALGLLLRFLLTGDSPPSDLGEAVVSARVKRQIDDAAIFGKSGLARIIGMDPHDKVLGRFAPVVWKALGLSRDKEGCLHLEPAYKDPEDFAHALKKVAA